MTLNHVLFIRVIFLMTKLFFNNSKLPTFFFFNLQLFKFNELDIFVADVNLIRVWKFDFNIFTINSFFFCIFLVDCLMTRLIIELSNSYGNNGYQLLCKLAVPQPINLPVKQIAKDLVKTI